MKNIFPLFKKSQITIFVVIAIVILSFILIFVFLFPKGGYSETQFSDNLGINARYNEIRMQIINCEKFLSQDALNLIGVQGGYYKVPKESYDISFIKIPYFYYEDGKKFLIPSDKVVKEQLEMFVDENIHFCIDSVDKQDFKITYEKPRTSVKIDKDVVTFETDLLVSIQRELSVSNTNLRDFPFETNSRIFDMLDFSRQLLDNHNLNPNLLCISCVSKLSDEKGFLVDVRRFNLNNQSVLITITQNDSESFPSTFEFLEKYKIRVEGEL